MKEKNLNRIVSHAMTCVLDEAEYYIFHSQAQGAFILFNSVYELMKVSLDGVTYLNSDQLTPNQKVCRSPNHLCQIRLHGLVCSLNSGGSC